VKPLDKIPYRAADCHVHIFDAGYPFCDHPRYVPETYFRGNAEQLTAALDSHEISHALLIAAAPYGTENGPIIDAIARSTGRFRGIALVDTAKFDEKKLQRLADSGVVGVRFNLALGLGQLIDEGCDRLLGWMKEAGWFLQIHSIADDLEHAMPLLKHSGVKLLFDHFGRPDIDRALDQPGFTSMLDAAAAGNAVVKLSGAFRVSKLAEPYADVAPLVERAINRFGIENCIWGSDWPFVNTTRRLDYGPQLAWLEDCVADEKSRRKILWENPARLFGFR
jgi:predicted TIM-barrel fold metal-dependent hydrolase